MSVLTLNVDEVMRTLSAESSNPFVTHDKEVDIVRFAINSGFADIVLDGQVALRVMYQRAGETEVRAKTLTYYDTDGLHNYYDWQLLSADLAEKGTITCALCILRTDSEVEEWHTTPCQIRVLDTIHTDDSDEADETITPTVAQRVAVLESMIQRVASGAPVVVGSTSDMTDTEQIYVLSTDGNWYYHNGTAWVAGGTYGAVETDTTLTQTGMAADAEVVGDIFGEISEDYSSSEGEIVINVPLDLTNIREGKRVSDTVGQTINTSDSSVTTAVLYTFQCEAGKTYTLTITNGSTPASIAERGTVVVTDGTAGSTVVWSKKTTNTANTQDIVEFTPTVSGYVSFNLDKNYQGVSVTTAESQTIVEKTAVDKQARSDISALQTTVNTMSGTVTQVLDDLENVTDTVDGIETAVDDVVEQYQDGKIDVEVTLDLSDVRVGKRSSDGIGQSVNLSNSSVTTCICNAFQCEAGKTYTLTITNGSTPASVASRGTVVVYTDSHVSYVLRSTNTTNAKDTLEFTPTASGVVYFNVDKNYQSVSVTALEDNIVNTAIDVKARNEIESVSKYILNGEIEKEIAFESGLFDDSLADVSGNGYRSGLITGVNGCAVCIKVNPSNTFVYGDGKNSKITIHGIYVIHPETDTIRIGLSDTPENVGFEMRVYKERGHKGRYDVIVAASDSSDEDKARADIVCDGVNDELDLQFAVNWNFFRRIRSIYSDCCNVLLLTGTYNIDSFTQQYSADGQLLRNRYGVVFGNNPYNGYRFYAYRASVEGCYELEHKIGNSGVAIKVSSAAVNTLGADINNAVFGLALKADGETGSFTSNSLSMSVKNLSIYTNGVANKIIAIDAYQAGNAIIKNCDVWATESTAYLPSATIETAPDGSIGIRAGRGSCLGVKQRIEGCRIIGFHEGIALCGEHYIVQDCAEIACYYGFTLNNYPTGGAVQHPNVFIGNSIEQCLNMAKFAESGNNDTFIYIGGSVENKLTQDDPAIPMKPIEISSNTRLRGRIESDSLASPYNNSFFYDGYGSSFAQTIYQYGQA